MYIQEYMELMVEKSVYLLFVIVSNPFYHWISGNVEILGDGAIGVGRSGGDGSGDTMEVDDFLGMDNVTLFVGDNDRFNLSNTFVLATVRSSVQLTVSMKARTKEIQVK